ncbi:HAD family hydrolase [Azohydromonas caseinilytica]|uniref:phosphoglycolate phosphatase n=1 Tax=Azohydromonas caseinilytica TaxID=2728836 RepID=A0A848FBW0_9BURK|nr:HAD-IA family hydrolase [Azohydromonas caseinilytica]NML15803.1 HAD-IA family hydrolase [Azohydromonas caseinilytica]
MRADALAFDLDGTLVDSAPDIAAALAAALRAEGFGSFELRVVRAWIGDGPDVLIRRALAAHGLDNPAPELLRRLRAHFDTTTLAAPLAHGRVFEGIEAVLDGLSEVLPIAVVTNKPTKLACAVVQAAGLMPYVTEVLGADTPALRKPEPALLHTAARQLGVAASRLLMVGDGPADLQAAAAAGCPAALVDWGYGGVADPGPAVWRLRAPQQLLALLPRQAAQAGL